jgi:hypothetical protein
MKIIRTSYRLGGWGGDNNVSEEELVNYIVKIMVKSKVGPKALPGFNAVRVVQEIRE